MPELRHVFKLWNGEVIIVPQPDAKRVMDRRGEWEQPQVVWEVKVNNTIRRLWPDEIQSWTAEDV